MNQDNCNLYALIISSSADSDKKIELIETFKPLIKKYAYLLDYEDAYCELVLDLIELASNFKKYNLKSKEDGLILSYVNKTMRHCYIKRSKKYNEYKFNNIFFDTSDEECIGAIISTSQKDNYVEIDSVFLSKHLTEAEFYVIKQIYYSDLSVNEIAKLRNTSRQSINQLKKRALAKLSKQLLDIT